MGNELNYRLAENSDKENVLSLLNLVFNKQQRSNLQRDDEFWNWKYVNSPFGKSILTVVEYNYEVIGVANLWPWEFNCRGKILKALQPCDSAVHPDFRGRGLFKNTRIFGLEIAKKDNYDLIFNFPNKNSLPTYQSLGWEYLGLIPWWVKIMNPLNVLKGFFLNDKAQPNKIDSAFNIDVSLLDELSRDFQSFDGFVKVNRINGYHQWRYLNHPRRDYGMVLYENGYKRTAAIFTVNQKGSNLEMVIVDIVGVQTNTVSLFKEIINVAKRLNVDLIAVMENSQLVNGNLWKLGFFRKKNKNLVALPLDLAIEEKVTNIKNWSLMAGMHDSI